MYTHAWSICLYIYICLNCRLIKNHQTFSRGLEPGILQFLCFPITKTSDSHFIQKNWHALALNYFLVNFDIPGAKSCAMIHSLSHRFIFLRLSLYPLVLDKLMSCLYRSYKMYVCIYIYKQYVCTCFLYTTSLNSKQILIILRFP